VLLGTITFQMMALAAFPTRTGYVTDGADLLPAVTERELESLLRETEATATTEIVVVTVASLDRLSVENYAQQLFNAWRIGATRNGRGVLIVVAPHNRAMRIEVARALAPILPDQLAAQIIADNMMPFFRNNQYEAGIVSGVTRVADIARRDRVLTPAERQTLSGVPGSSFTARWRVALNLLFLVGVTIAPFLLGRGIQQRKMLTLIAGAAAAAATWLIAPAPAAFSIWWWLVWVPVAGWVAFVLAVALQDFEKIKAESLEKEARARAEYEAQRAAREADPVVATPDEPDHWIFKRATEPAPDGWIQPDEDRRDRARRDDRSGSNSSSGGGASGRW
jgi:uncharacterized protein